MLLYVERIRNAANIRQHGGGGFGTVEDVVVDAGDAGFDEGLGLLGGEIDADFELFVVGVAGGFEAFA